MIWVTAKLIYLVRSNSNDHSVLFGFFLFYSFFWWKRNVLSSVFQMLYYNSRYPNCKFHIGLQLQVMVIHKRKFHFARKKRSDIDLKDASRSIVQAIKNGLRDGQKTQTENCCFSGLKVFFSLQQGLSEMYHLRPPNSIFPRTSFSFFWWLCYILWDFLAALKAFSYLPLIGIAWNATRAHLSRLYYLPVFDCSTSANIPTVILCQ